MNELPSEIAEFPAYRVYLRLQLRYLLLKFSNLCLKVRLFRLQCAIAILQLRFAIILHIHEHYPFLFWF